MDLNNPQSADDDIAQVSTTTADDRCPICWNEITHKIKLPCSHEFCFLCAKGAVLRSLRCPMCRGDVPDDFFDHCTVNSENMNIATFEGSYHWYYEGRNGWWLFDARVSEEIEEEYQKGVDTGDGPNVPAPVHQCEVMIAGFMYTIDFTEMVQYRRDSPGRKRKIKRDQAEVNTKGIAGLRGNINFI